MRQEMMTQYHGAGLGDDYRSNHFDKNFVEIQFSPESPKPVPPNPGAPPESKKFQVMITVGTKPHL